MCLNGAKTGFRVRKLGQVQALVGRWTWHGPAPWGPLPPSSPPDRPRTTRAHLGSLPPGRSRPPRVGARGLTPPRVPRPAATRRIPPGATHAGHPLLRPAHAATPRSRTEGLHQTWRDGRPTHSCGTGTPPGRRAAVALLPRPGRVLGDGAPGPALPQAWPG